MSASPSADAVPAPARVRLDSIDLLRGAVMILMALDHARDFYTSPAIDPTDLAATTPILFATRWVTHFCAPVFSFLAGTGAFLSAARGKPARALSWFLFTRGLWLVLLDLTIVHVGFAGFNPGMALITLWALGCSMIALAGLVFLPSWAVGAIGAVILLGHDSLDGFHGGGALWRVLHRGGPIGSIFDVRLFVAYPILPWIGVMAAGYAFGEVMVLPAPRRRRLLWTMGLGLIGLFLLLRGPNLYGDPSPWSPQAHFEYSIMSFVNTSKYPPSLLYALMTLGPALLVLALLDGVQVSRDHFVVVFGRVPMFYYLLHLFVLHIPAWLFFGRRYGAAVFNFSWRNTPSGYGLPLAAAYIAWALGVLALYPLCRWYAAIKATSKNPWLSYL